MIFSADFMPPIASYFRVPNLKNKRLWPLVYYQVTLSTWFDTKKLTLIISYIPSSSNGVLVPALTALDFGTTRAGTDHVSLSYYYTFESNLHLKLESQRYFNLPWCLNPFKLKVLFVRKHFYIFKSIQPLCARLNMQEPSVRISCGFILAHRSK